MLWRVSCVVAAVLLLSCFDTGAGFGFVPSVGSAALRQKAQCAISGRIPAIAKPQQARRGGCSVRMCAAEVEVLSENGPGVPKTEEQMLEAARNAVKKALEDGFNRQKVRMLLPRDGALVPTDEDWPGGIMQLYKACSPLVRALLRKLSTADGGIGATCKEQRLDESGVDGVSLWTALAPAAKDDISAFCQPSVETVDAVKQVCKSAGPRLVMIVNPQWRETVDSYDALGQQSGFLGQLGNFLGGTSGARKEIAELGFKDVYLLQQFVVRGDDCQIVNAYPYDEWFAYTTSDNGKNVMLGRQKDRPTYQDIAKMLEEKGVAAKWAREAGIGKGFSE